MKLNAFVFSLSEAPFSLLISVEQYSVKINLNISEKITSFSYLQVLLRTFKISLCQTIFQTTLDLLVQRGTAQCWDSVFLLDLIEI